MRQLAQALIVAAVVSFYVQSALAIPTPAIDVLQTKTERGSSINITVSGTTIGVLSGYDAYLTGHSGFTAAVSGDIVIGDFFTTPPATVSAGLAPPHLYVELGAPNWAEDHQSATLATFKVQVGMTVPLGANSISTAGTTFFDDWGFQIDGVPVASDSIMVYAPQLAMTLGSFNFNSVLLTTSSTVGSTITNSSDEVTILNGVFGSIGNVTLDGVGYAGPNPFTFAGGNSAFDLAGGIDNWFYSIQFAPTVAGLFEASFNITSDSSIGGKLPTGTVTTVTLRGLGTVPEPATLSLLAVGALALIRRKR